MDSYDPKSLEYALDTHQLATTEVYDHGIDKWYLTKSQDVERIASYLGMTVQKRKRHLLEDFRAC
jgi:hypothetical protein